MANKITHTTESYTSTSKPQPVQLLSTVASYVYNHAHLALVLSIFYARFPATVADPVKSLTTLLLLLAIQQAVFACVCVPASSESKPITPSQSSGKPSQLQRRKPKPTTWQGVLIAKLIPAILSVILATTVPTLPLLILAVLHGAPVTTHIPETLLLAAHLAVLSCVPLFYAHGVSSSRWRTIYSLQAPMDELMCAAIGTMVGAWFGAVPIPLDWDREWQRWPVTVVTGAYAGWAVGRTLGSLPGIKGKYIRFD